MSKKVIVIGAGASGMAAAVSAAASGAEVTVLEGMKKPGRKLLLTGSGRCNLTNTDPGLASAYGSLGNGTWRDEPFVYPAVSANGAAATLQFFEEIGVTARCQDGYVYPASGQAQTVLSALEAEMHRLRIKTKYNSRVIALGRDEETGLWSVSVDGWSYKADAVILCCGSMAAPQTGSDGSGYALARSVGHTVTEIRPALTALLVSDSDLKIAAGARTRASVRLISEASSCVSPPETGEVQWNENAVSGIAVFQLSRMAGDLLKGGPVRLITDLVPGRTAEEVEMSIRRMRAHFGGKMTPGAVLCGFMHDRVASYIERRLKREGLLGDGSYGESPDAAQLAEYIKSVTLDVTGLRSFEQAQCARGGVSLDEVRSETLESRISPGLYFAGEILDIDGPCGGYNLQWAWSSGFLAGRSAANHEKTRT
ncbi:MAG: aminoacetone oxidase family FAD-binding enzyme [Lachnospiraceae bacterium]|nr:aminoacetone oxidase family FAD-binding enzyme [Lachnospiraceae bacterium]